MLDWIISRFKQQSLDDVERARELIRETDRGGTHPDPEKVRQIARRLGLHVSPGWDTDKTIRHIRSHLARHEGV